MLFHKFDMRQQHAMLWAGPGEVGSMHRTAKGIRSTGIHTEVFHDSNCCWCLAFLYPVSQNATTSPQLTMSSTGKILGGLSHKSGVDYLNQALVSRSSFAELVNSSGELRVSQNRYTTLSDGFKGKPALRAHFLDAGSPKRNQESLARNQREATSPIDGFRANGGP